MDRVFMLRVAAVVIALGAVLGALLWPDTCMNCTGNVWDDFLSTPVMNRHIVPRILLAATGLALGAVIAAFTFSKKGP